MANITRDLTLKLQTTKDSDVEDMHFCAGDVVTVVQTWQDFYLIKDAEGHFYTVAKDAVQP